MRQYGEHKEDEGHLRWNRPDFSGELFKSCKQFGQPEHTKAQPQSIATCKTEKVEQIRIHARNKQAENLTPSRHDALEAKIQPEQITKTTKQTWEP